VENLKIEKPFNGKTIVLLGDSAQLRPVSARIGQHYRPPYCCTTFKFNNQLLIQNYGVTTGFAVKSANIYASPDLMQKCQTASSQRALFCKATDRTCCRQVGQAGCQQQRAGQGPCTAAAATPRCHGHGRPTLNGLCECRDKPRT